MTMDLGGGKSGLYGMCCFRNRRRTAPKGCRISPLKSPQTATHSKQFVDHSSGSRALFASAVEFCARGFSPPWHPY
jgi:hypothetical protein